VGVVAIGLRSPPTREITVQELRRHDQPGDLWVAVSGLVYNVSSFANVHPGGAKVCTALTYHSSYLAAVLLAPQLRCHDVLLCLRLIPIPPSASITPDMTPVHIPLASCPASFQIRSIHPPALSIVSPLVGNPSFLSLGMLCMHSAFSSFTSLVNPASQSACFCTQPHHAQVLEELGGHDVTEEFYELHRAEVLTRPGRERLIVGRLAGQFLRSCIQIWGSRPICSTPFSISPLMKMEHRHRILPIVWLLCRGFFPMDAPFSSHMSVVFLIHYGGVLWFPFFLRRVWPASDHRPHLCCAILRDCGAAVAKVTVLYRIPQTISSGSAGVCRC
jgi:hypothetical protein